MKVLIEAGADVNAVLPEGETILMTAARTGRPEAVKLLLDAGAKVDAREQWYGESALHWAAAEDHAEARQPAGHARRQRRRALRAARRIAGDPGSP